MIRCGKTGATLLYGTKCVGCDCRPSGFASGGFVRPDEPGTVRVMGFDLASEPDMTVNAKYGASFEITVDDLEYLGSTNRLRDEELARHARAWEEALLRALNVPPSHFNCRSTVRPPAVEIITNPSDQRGMDAKRVGGRAA